MHSVGDTWASGAAELLWHARSHLDFDSEFDHRIAFVSIDNAVELTLRTYLGMPSRFFDSAGLSLPLAEGKRPPQQFGQLLDLVEKHAGEKLAGVDFDKILFFHRVRNRLYHDGIGTPPSRTFTSEYFEIALGLLRSLLGYELPETSPTFERLQGDVLSTISAEFEAEMVARRRRSISAGLKRVVASGQRLGREPKALTLEEQEYAVKRHVEDNWGAEKIAREITVRRGAHTLTDPAARLKASVGPKVVRRTLQNRGAYDPHKRGGRAPARGEP